MQIIGYKNPSYKTSMFEITRRHQFLLLLIQKFVLKVTFSSMEPANYPWSTIKGTAEDRLK